MPVGVSKSQHGESQLGAARGSASGAASAAPIDGASTLIYAIFGGASRVFGQTSVTVCGYYVARATCVPSSMYISFLVALLSKRTDLHRRNIEGIPAKSLIAPVFLDVSYFVIAGQCFDKLNDSPP